MNRLLGVASTCAVFTLFGPLGCSTGSTAGDSSFPIVAPAHDGGSLRTAPQPDPAPSQDASLSSDLPTATADSGTVPNTSDAAATSDAQTFPPIACNETPPPGAPQADPLPTYAGTCPTFAAAPNLTTFTSSGNPRSFMVVAPSTVAPGEQLPVIFLWYWLGGSADDFYDRASVQIAVEQQRFIAVIPQAKGDLPLKWPFNILDSDARMDEEFQFFDDMLACVSAAYPTVNKNCVSTVGVSAGALFTDQLAAGRANRLSSFESLSGGVGGVIRGWGNPAHKLPGLVLWGGTDDICVAIDFQTESQTLESNLGSGGDFILECVHNCGHAEPPMTAPPGESQYASLWQFVFDHPFWLGAGDSPYTSSGLPSVYPSWCAVGAGHAVPRTGGMCPPSGC